MDQEGRGNCSLASSEGGGRMHLWIGGVGGIVPLLHMSPARLNQCTPPSPRAVLIVSWGALFASPTTVMIFKKPASTNV